MIVEFSVKNFRSIKELQTLSFVATSLESPNQFPEIDTDNIVKIGNTKLLKTVGIYGANGSGKSNIIRALEYFINAIRKEPSSESNLSLLCDPFLYQEDANIESFFQIILTINDNKFRYGFTVKTNLNYDPNEKSSKEIITNEWLFKLHDDSISDNYFVRDGKDVIKDNLPNSDKIPVLPYEHTLFLTHAAAFDSEGDCTSIRNFFIRWTISNLTNGFRNFRYNTLLLIEKENKKDLFLEVLSSFNLKYNDIIIERDSVTDQQVIGQDKIYLTKTYRNKKNESIDIKLNLQNNESSGTQKLFDLIGLILRAFMMKLSVFVMIDEIDSDFHPSLLISLIKLFNNPSINKNHSQLLFTSHDTNLMSPSIMRRDQFYFTEKDNNDSTRVYSLVDLKGIRDDADFAKQYLAGFYGALPVLENFSNTTLKQLNESLGV